MIRTEHDVASGSTIIVLQPNRSLSWRANLYLVASLLVLSLAIGIAFFVRNFWLILPFTLAEIALLASCLYLCVRQTHRQEVLRLNYADVILQRGSRTVDEELHFIRFFTRFFVHPGRHRGHSKTIALACRGHETEIGSFLNEQEKNELIAALRAAIARLDSEPLRS